MRRGEFPVNALPAWCALNDVTFIDCRADHVQGRGYGLVAEKDLVNEQDNFEVPTLLSVPKDLVLSAEAVEEYAKQDVNFRALLEAAGHQSHRQDILLYLLAQLALSSPDLSEEASGVATPWTQYFSLLPDQVSVPTMWTEAELAQLRGSSLEAAVSAKLQVLTSEFNHVRAKSSDISYWYELLWVDESVTVHDWVLLDALYRSRSLELPTSGESMVPCLDLVNHSRQPSAHFEQDNGGQVTLLLRKGCALSAGHEVTIDYGQTKSAAEMLFSYGFLDSNASAKSLVLPLEPMDDDPLAKAKLHVLREPPFLRIEDAENGIPQWAAPSIYLLCLNEEDGLQFGLLQEHDGSRHLRVYWQEQDVTEAPNSLETLIRGHELHRIFELRTVTLLQERVERQLASLQHDTAVSGLARADILEAALQLRDLEADLLERTKVVLEEQKTRLLEDESVISYLDSMVDSNPDEHDVFTAEASNEEDEDFS